MDLDKDYNLNVIREESLSKKNINKHITLRLGKDKLNEIKKEFDKIKEENKQKENLKKNIPSSPQLKKSTENPDLRV